MPSFSILRTRCICTGSMNSRKILLDILNNRRLLLDSAKYATNLSPTVAMHSFGRNEWLCCLNRRKEEFRSFPLLQIELQTSRNEVLGQSYSTDGKLQQVRKGDQHNIIESSQARTGQLTVGQKGCFTLN